MGDPNPSDIAFQNQMDIIVYHDVSSFGTVCPTDTTNGYSCALGHTTVTINAGPTPTENITDVVLNGTNSGNLVIQLRQHFANGGTTDTVHYDSVATPSSFIFPWVPPTGGTPPTVTTGTQAFANYGSPPGFQTRDGAQRQNSGEPSIGSDWATSKIMYMAGTQVSQIGFDTSQVPPAATWKDVTSAQLSVLSEDSILFTNAATNRTWAEDFYLNGACNAIIQYTDTDGGPGGGPMNPATNTAWTQEQCPFAEGPDHPSVGAGPYFGTPPVTSTDKSQVVYYCAQDGLNAAGSECTHSENGGLTWGAPTVVFGTATTPCRSIHGHIRTGPDGTMYIPNSLCGGTSQGIAKTQNLGSSFTYSVIPDATTGATDPSVAVDNNNTVYFGYEDGLADTHAKIAVSHDHGGTWAPSADLSAAFNLKNVAFPEVIAGATGRAAFSFLGTTTGGDYQVGSFTGVWYLYVGYTYDGGNSWQVVNATPNDPVQRGCVDNGGATSGTYVGCRNMLDFNDITVDKQGARLRRLHRRLHNDCHLQLRHQPGDHQSGGQRRLRNERHTGRDLQRER